jgi:hypothetical protein
MFIATWASLVFSPGGATSILSDVAPDGAWTDYFLVSINIPPLRGLPSQNPLVPGELNLAPQGKMSRAYPIGIYISKEMRIRPGGMPDISRYASGATICADSIGARLWRLRAAELNSQRSFIWRMKYSLR